MANAGYKLGKDVLLGMDAAASEFVESRRHVCPWHSKQKGFPPDQLNALYLEWHEKYHLVSVEDGLAEDDWDALARSTPPRWPPKGHVGGRR